jgi:hypothetical protein
MMLLLCYYLYRYFDKYEDIGEFCDLNVLDHLGGAMLLSNKLAFLGNKTL